MDNLIKRIGQFTLLLMVIFASCNIDVKYEKELWQETDSGFSSPYRDRMLRDLTTNYNLKGMKIYQLRKLLGPADHVENGLIAYRVKIEYGGDTDPVYTKNLNFNYSKDSTITSFKVIEWR
jgi:hypothetical protein